MRYFWTLTFCLFCATAMASPLTVDRVPKATASAVIEDGQIVDNGANVGMARPTRRRSSKSLGRSKRHRLWEMDQGCQVWLPSRANGVARPEAIFITALRMSVSGHPSHKASSM